MQKDIKGFTGLPWSAFEKGDRVWIPGNLDQNGEPTKVYGPHWVEDVENRVLVNHKHHTFYERWPVLFVEKTE